MKLSKWIAAIAMQLASEVADVAVLAAAMAHTSTRLALATASADA